MSAARPKINNTFLMGTILLVAVLFVYYFLVHIPAKEEAMSQRGIRIMNRMSKNLKDKEAHYKNSIDNFRCQYLLRQILEQNQITDQLKNLQEVTCLSNVIDQNSVTSLLDSIQKIEEKFKQDSTACQMDIEPDVYKIKSKETFKKFKTIYKLDKLTSQKNKAKQDLYQNSNLYNNINALVKKLDNKVKVDQKSNAGKYLYWEYQNQDTLVKELTDSTLILGIKPEVFSDDIKRFEFFDDIFIVDAATNQIIDNSHLGLGYFDINHLKPVIKVGEEIEPSETKEVVQFSGVKISEKEISNSPYYAYSLVVKIKQNNYHLVALIGQDKYNNGIKEVSIWVVVVFIVFLIFLIQILPVVKPFLLSRKERLQSIDMVWAGLSVVFGVAALSMLSLSFDTYQLEEIALVDEKLSLYGDTIKSDFKKETNLALDILSAYRKDSANLFNPKNQDLFKKIYNPQKPFFSFLNINKNGYSRAYIHVTLNNDTIKYSNNPGTLDLRHRNYFKVHAQSDSIKVWETSRFKSGKKTPYFIESIFSMSSGRYETTVSVKANPDTILALVYPFASVNNRYLEPNYTYCIFDKKGNIVYHSDAKKIGYENFFDESNLNENLKAYTRNNTNANLNINFALTDYRANVQPLPNSDWHIATLYNIKNSRLTIASSLGIVFELVLVILIYLVFLNLLLKIQRARDKNFRKKSFAFYFLNPLAIPRLVYFRLLIVNVAVIIYLVVLYKYFYLSIFQNFVLFFAVITVNFLYNYVVLSGFRLREADADETSKNPLTFFEISLLFLTLLWSAIFYTGITPSNLSTEVVFILPILVLIINIIYEKFTANKTDDKKWMDYKSLLNNHYHFFYLHVLTWVLIVGVIPTLLFFKPIYNLQHIKRNISQLSTEYSQRLGSQNWSSTKTSLFHATPLNHIDNLKCDTVQLINQKKSLDFLELIDPYFEKDKIDLKGQARSKIDQISILKCYDNNRKSSFFKVNYTNAPIYKNSQQIEPNTLIVFSLPQILTLKPGIIGVVFWLFILLNTIGLYVLIILLSEKFFYLRLTLNLAAATPKYFGDDLSHQKQRSKVSTKVLVKNEKNIILVGVPFSGRKEAAKALIAKQDEIQYLDFRTELEKLHQTLEKIDLKKPIIVINFDHRIYDIKHNIYKIEILESLIGKRNEADIEAKFIIISSFDIYELLGIYQEKISALMRDKNNNQTTEIEELNINMNRWKTLLYSFSKHIIPLKQTKSIDFIKSELQFGKALEKLIPRVVTYNNQLNKENLNLSDKEHKLKLIEAIVDMAENYYFSIWKSCSREEKFLLLDLAEDGLLNAENNRAIYGLIRKGILVLKPHISIFNQSFKFFIQEAISEEETKAIEKEARSQGTFKSYQYLVIFLVIVTLIFLSFAEKQAIAKITTLISLSAVLFPSIIKIFTSVTTKNNIFNKGN